MTDTTIDVSHVRQSRQHLLNLTKEERLMICLQDVFIEYPNSQAILNAMHYMLRTENKVQAPCMLVWGSGGYGKTSIINKIKEVNKNEKHKLVFMSFRQNPNNYNFRELLLEAFGMEVTKKFSGYNASKEFARTVERNNIKGIVIDEIHDAVTLSTMQQKINLSLLKNLSGDQYNLSVFAFGVDKASEALRLDPQLERRYLQWPLEKWKLNEEFRGFIAAYERTLPLKQPSHLHSKELATAILKQADGVMDNVVKIIQVCAAEAVSSGIEKITIELITNAPFLAAKYGVSLLRRIKR
jgi:hypothetical protein